MPINPKIMSGARAIISIAGKPVGSCSSISYNRALDTQDAFVCGRTGPAAIEYVAQEPVTGSMSGWRCVDGGPAVIGVPQLIDLLTADYLEILVVDRLTNKTIKSIYEVRLLGESGGQSARQLSEYSIPFKGMVDGDETTGKQSERSDAASL